MVTVALSLYTVYLEQKTAYSLCMLLSGASLLAISRERRGMRAAQTLMPRKKEESTVLVFVVHWTVPSSWGEGRSRALEEIALAGAFSG